MIRTNYTIYTDGSSDNIRKPHYGGWGYVILKDGAVIYEDNGSDVNTTNNQMELSAIIKSVINIPENSNVTFCTDSQYCITVLDHKDKDFPKNMDLINVFREVVKEKNLSYTFKWVKGHNGDRYNEMADSLANEAFLAVGGQLNKYITGEYKAKKKQSKVATQKTSSYRDKAILAYTKAKSLEEFMELLGE